VAEAVCERPTLRILASLLDGAIVRVEEDEKKNINPKDVREGKKEVKGE
jgi:hypothetical protein